MTYDEGLADRLRDRVPADARERKMFGGLAFLIGGNMSVAASAEGGLIVRVPPEDTERLLDEPGASEFRMGQRAGMAGWLRVSAEALASDTALDAWVQRGVAYASSLPPKR